MSTKKDHHKFFTLILEEYNEDGLLEATKVPARKGKTLFDLVEPIFENYGLSFDSHSVYLGSSSTPLPLHEETYPYRGYTLYARENEKFRIISFRRSDSRKSPTGAAKRFSQLLDEYETVGFEAADKTDGLKEEQGSEELTLGESWKDVIGEDSCATNRQKVQQEAIWELFSTELNYITDLQVVTDVFKRCFKMLQYAGYLTEVDETLIFANIEEVYNVNIIFWRRLKEIIETVKRTRLPITPTQIVESFSGFNDLFLPYITYCNTDMSSIKLPDFPSSTNDLIKQFISWCDNHARCKRITLAGFLIKPVQRVTKYTLLLRAIRKKTDNDIERGLLEDIMMTIETFISKMNSTVHMRKEQEKLDNAVSRLSDYCPLEPFNDEVDKIMKTYCNLNLKGCIPGLAEDENRFLLKEGPIKLVGKQGKKDVYAFLFSDILLITKLKRNCEKYRINHQPYLLSRIRLHELKDYGQFLMVYLNELDVMTNAFILMENTDEGESWRMAIENARNSYDQIRKALSVVADDDSLPDTNDMCTDFPDNNQVTEFRSRSLSVRKNTFIQQTPDTPELPVDVPITMSTEVIKVSYEWDDGLSLAFLFIVIGFNLMISRLLGG